MTKIAGSRSASGSISQRHGSADPDPQHCLQDRQAVGDIFSPVLQRGGGVHRIGRPEADPDQVDGPRGAQLREIHLTL